MKKLIFFLFPLLFFLSCSKESDLPDEYQYLIGNWTLKNCIVSTVSYDPHYPYTTYDTLLPESFGYDHSIRIDDNSIDYYLEKTKVKIVDNYISVEVNTGVYSGETMLFFYLIYRDVIGGKKGELLTYIPSVDILQVYSGRNYEFNYIRE